MEGGLWGLVIVFSAFMIQVLAFGSSIMIGVYNIELLEYFQGNTVGVSLISSLNFGIFLGSGPMVSFLMTKFSFRKIALFGSALVVLGLLGMRLLPYIPTMCICFGLMCGFGGCCTYIPSHVLSGMYYEKNRSLATGVATSGSGIGGAVLPIVAGLLIETYSWKGSLVVVAGLCLHLFVFSALLRMPDQAKGKECGVDNLENAPSSQRMLPEEAAQLEKYAKPHKVSESPDACKITEVDGDCKPLISEIDTAQTTNLKDFYEIQPDNAEISNNESRTRQRSLRDSDNEADDTSVTVQSHAQTFKGNDTKTIVIDKQDELCSTQNETLPKYSRHVYIFTNYGFDIYFLSNVMWNIGGAIVASFTPEYLHNQGLTSKEAAFLFGVLGFGNFLGGILGGVLGNFPRINRKMLYTFTNIFLGVILAAFPTIGHRDIYFLYMLVGGTAFGVILGLLIIVLTDLVGIESLSNGLGYLMLANGIGTFIGPPLGGALKEATGDFGSSIVLSGVLCVCAGLIMLLLPCERFLRNLCSPCCPSSHEKRHARFHKDVAAIEGDIKLTS